MKCTNIQIHDGEHILMVRVEEDAGIVEDEQALDIAAAAQVCGEAGGVLPS